MTKHVRSPGEGGPRSGDSGQPDARVGSDWVRAIVLGLVTVAAVTAAVTLDAPAVADVRVWLERVGPLAWVLMILGLAAALVTPAPRSALSIAVAVVAGFWAGLIVVVLAAVLGGLAGYVLSSWLGRAAVVRLAGDRLSALERRLDRQGFLAVVIARISPLPFMVVSYAAGLSGVRLAPYMAATTAGVLPGSVLYVSIGSSLWLFAEWRAYWPMLLGLVALVVLAIFGLASWRRRRRPPHP